MCLFHQTLQQNPMPLFPNDGCLCRMCVMVRLLLAAGSRLLGCTNSPEARLARVLFFPSCHWIRSPSLACFCFPLCSFIRMRCVVRHIFRFPPSPPDPFLIQPSRPLALVLPYVRYSYKAALFTAEIFSCEPWPTTKKKVPHYCPFMLLSY